MARVVRGGSFNNNARNVRCAVRNNNNPNNRNENNGFRVVVSHTIPKRQSGPAPVLPAGQKCRVVTLPGRGDG